MTTPALGHGRQLAADVVRASARTYRQVGEDVQFLTKAAPSRGWTGITVPGLRRLEHVELKGRFGPRKVSWLRRIRTAGYEVWVLVPLEEISAAHAQLRGVVDRLQPWWIESGEVRFGVPRIP